MMKSKRILVTFLCVIIGLALVACAGNKDAASTAIKAAKDTFDKGNYDAALSAAKAIPDKVKELSTAAAAKKTELTKAWDEMSAGLPKMLDAVKSRLDILSQSKKLPAGLDKAKLDGAKSGYATAVKMWDDAKAAFAGGNMADAMAKAATVKEKAVEVMTTLGMQVPAAATATKG